MLQHNPINFYEPKKPTIYELKEPHLGEMANAKNSRHQTTSLDIRLGYLSRLSFLVSGSSGCPVLAVQPGTVRSGAGSG